MKKIRNKKIILMMLTLTMLLSVCMVTTAASTSAATKNSLRSQGAIRYQEGTESVVIDSADLYTLADRLDLFKVRVAEQLGEIGTYLSRNPSGTQLTSDEGVYAVHQKPSSSGEADPLLLSFDTILEGIAASQSIPTDPAVYGMGAGATLYKGTDGKLYSSAQEGAEEIRIQAATAENLSAGTAAWVNGRLILGTGGDNKTYHDLGYREGSGGQGSESSDDVNKARVIDMNGSSSYVVQEDMTDVFLCFSRAGGYTTPILSSGESIKLVIKNVESSLPWLQWSIYYAPKLSKGTVISNLHETQNDKVMSLLITIEDSHKNGKVSGIRLSQSTSATDYVIEEDMTDVFLYLTAPKSKMPDFTPMDDQTYVSFKLLKEASHGYDDKGNAIYGSLYYIPRLKAGTRISNINPYRAYMVY
ncbi:MAG: hypothetical protein HDR05_03910 [Lachnospiraceae bacterium]|nr:hypothetical protein [Lachnospiraceae bacterium]